MRSEVNTPEVLSTKLNDIISEARSKLPSVLVDSFPGNVDDLKVFASTFFAGLLPVIGNLISNTAIFIARLSVSIYAGAFALIFLVVIHKLEYFFNARIVGSSIYARAWELLIAMLVMEVAFGIGGLVIAPIYYAYIKRELTDRNLV